MMCTQEAEPNVHTITPLRVSNLPATITRPPKTALKSEHLSALLREPRISRGTNSSSPWPAFPNSLPR